LIAVEIVRKNPDQVGFVVNPRRWVVERFFAWIGCNLRLAKDFEATIESARAFFYAASVMLLVRRIARTRSLAHGFTHFLYGTTEETLTDLRRNLAEKFPKLRIVGAIAPPFRALTPAEDAEIVTAINRASPDFVWLGLSCPKQEIWMAEHRSRLDAGVLIGVGAAFDIHAGRVRQAPLWMQRHGLEWLFRVYQEPRRLARRYFYSIARFLLEIAAQKTGLRHYSCEL
jgi:exopolysaccharide biosynthesis WecB/TagA/CpsF family protein